MKRTKWLLAAGGALVLALVCLLIVVARTGPPFEFMSGADAAKIEQSTVTRKGAQQSRTHRSYHVPRPTTELLRKAREELAAHGWTEDLDDPFQGLAGEDGSYIFDGPDGERIQLSDDLRDGTYIYFTRETTAVDRFEMWLWNLSHDPSAP